MTRDEIQATLIAMLKELQSGAGEPSGEITGVTQPLKDLGFFDSLLALETTISLEERLGASFGQDSVFSDKESDEPLSVAEIAERLTKVPGASA